MEKFSYSGVDTAGSSVSGTEVAETRSAAHLALLERGIQNVEVRPKKNILQFEITRKRVKRKDLMHFSRQLGVFVKAGIPIVEALEVIGSETTDKVLKPKRATPSRPPPRRTRRPFPTTTSGSSDPRNSRERSTSCSTSSPSTSNETSTLDRKLLAR
jgi:hypothetical protein